MYDYLTRGLGLGQVTVLYYHIVPTLPSFVSYSMYAIQLQASITLLCWASVSPFMLLFSLLILTSPSLMHLHTT
jgi:hypothetical protein